MELNKFLRVDKYDIESTNDLNSSDIIDGDKSPRLQKICWRRIALRFQRKTQKLSLILAMKIAGLKLNF